jgi:hypothetical protein
MLNQPTKFNQLVESILNEKDKNWDTRNRATGERAVDRGSSLSKKADADVVKALRFIHAYPPATGALGALESYIEEYRSIERMRKNLMSANAGSRESLEIEIEQRENDLNSEMSNISEERIISGIEEAIRAVGAGIESAGIEDSSSVFNADALVRTFRSWISARSEGGDKSPMMRVISAYIYALTKNEGIFNTGIKGMKQDPLAALVSDYIKPRKSAIGNSHAGRQALKKNKPQQAKIVKLVKGGQLDAAAELAGEGTALADMIQQLKDGNITEADVVRSIYQGN